MTKPVLLAGLLGGLLGGIGGFALVRSFPASAKPPVVVEVPKSEVRERADDLVAKLREGQEDAFFHTLRTGYVSPMTDEAFQKLREHMTGLRKDFTLRFGAPGDIEFSRENVVSSSLVRVVYLAKHARGCVALFVVFYNTQDGWRILGLTYVPVEDVFKELR